MLGLSKLVKFGCKGVFHRSLYIPKGLLKNASDQFYSCNVDNITSYELIKSSKVLWKAIESDLFEMKGDVALSTSIYLEKVLEGGSDFLKNGDVCGRKNIIEALTSCCEQKGHLVIVSGGYSVGKSFILSQVLKEQNQLKLTKVSRDGSKVLEGHLVLKVDGRYYKRMSLDQAIIDQLNLCGPEVSNPIFSALLDKIQSTHGVGISADVDEKTALQPCNVLSQLMHAAVNADVPLQTLIIDEANAFFTPETEADKRTALAALELLVKLTKQDRKLNVIVCTGQYELPFELQKMGFDFKHFSRHLLVGDPSPVEAIATVKAWGAGDNLASALVDIYGGNLSLVWNAIFELALPSTLQDVEQYVKFGGTCESSHFRACMAEASCTMGLKARAISTLKTLAVKGFAPLHPNVQTLVTQAKNLVGLSTAVPEQQVADLLTRHNLAGFVPHQARAEHFPPGTRTCDGLVPSTQAMRMLLVRELTLIGEMGDK